MAQLVKNPHAVQETACNAGDPGSISRSGKAPGEGNAYPLLYSCLDNPTDRGAWRATVPGVAQSQTRLKRLSTQDVSVTTSYETHLAASSRF